MRFTETGLKGAFVIDVERLEDPRGFFARSWCRHEFEERGLDSTLAQCSLSYNTKKGALRGMHWQAEPRAEAKLVRCTMGSVFDVIVDMRPLSPTYKKWFGAELGEDNRRMIYVPRGFAHGFQTLVDSSEVFYQMSEFFEPSLARGFRWDDPTIAIRWPIRRPIISEKDALLGDFCEEKE